MHERRRRSARIGWLMLGAAAFALSACEDRSTAEEQDAPVFSSVESCAWELDEATCREALADARTQHLETAPRFRSREECLESGAQDCEPLPEEAAVSGGSGFFIPALAGFMLGRSLRAAAGPRVVRPVYLDRQGFLYSGRGMVGALPAGRTSLGPQPTTVRTRVTPQGEMRAPRTVQRRGFSSRAGGG